MINWIIYIGVAILGWLFSLFPTVSFDLSAPVGSVLQYINTFHNIMPTFFDTFFKTFWLGNVLGYLAIINVMILRFLPVYKK